ncbi:DNA polymerase III subunit delta' [Streptococcus entericus]|uniref:DNA polymerase III subunit delta' n=1 Tax=Streptococcus entericus TaxID=155680 RepID=UPI00037D6FCE|nr:DNA polymerase III subunit delta' [Streptococcus entericus]
MREVLTELQPNLLASFDGLLARGRLSHAYLFSGEFGSFELALYLAQSRFCEDLSAKNLPCGKCRSCRLIASGEFTDVTVVEPMGQLIKTEQIRELARDFAQSGYEGDCQVFIIKDADKMHTNAANSLLKQIEEPTSNYYIFLLTSDEEKVLPTIKSRCQLFRCPTDRAYLLRQFEATGLLKSQASLLAELTNSPHQLADLAANKRLLDLIGLCQRLIDQLLAGKEEAYLQVSRLVNKASDKTEQDWCFRLLTSQAAQSEQANKGAAIVEKLYQVRRMWQANVSFQNALDYLVLTLEEEE